MLIGVATPTAGVGRSAVMRFDDDVALRASRLW
jgi:hypothetical protein